MLAPDPPPERIILLALHSSRKESNIAIVSKGPPADSGWNCTPVARVQGNTSADVSFSFNMIRTFKLTPDFHTRVGGGLDAFNRRVLFACMQGGGEDRKKLGQFEVLG